MKIKVINKPFEEVVALPVPKKKRPKKPSIFFRTLVRVLASGDLRKVRFKFTGEFDKKAGPYLVLMNHSSFIDLKIAHKILYPMPFTTVCTHDALVGKGWLMRQIGCFPTKKFVTDLSLISDMRYALHTKKTSVLMYPEAGYSLDGRATKLPDNFGRLVKVLKVPVLFIEAKGAFTRDPLYNGLRLRKVPVSASVTQLFSKEQIEKLSAEEITSRINVAFSFDNFAWQLQYKVKTQEEFIAEGLERVLYRCPNCETEGEMRGEGRKLACAHCGKEYQMNDFGQMTATSGRTEFSHVPDWFDWQRQKVREELLSGEYLLDVPVRIAVMKDYKALYVVGEGRLTHTLDGFKLTGCDGKLNYEQKAEASYGLNADYFWYEIGDIICIGDNDMLYYCFPPEQVPVAKTRLATEELYKIRKEMASAKEKGNSVLKGAQT